MNNNIAVLLGNILTKQKQTIAVAESCTGGLISKLLTDVSGSSNYISLNVVTYSNEAKTKILGVKQKTLEEFGTVSEETVKEMAEGIKSLTGSDFGLGITGVAGPTGGTPEKPVGLVYIGLADKKRTISEKLIFSKELHREEVREKAAEQALHLLRDFITSNS